MSIIYPIFLSTTQPNDNLPTMLIRQFDEGTQVLDVTITEFGNPKDITGMTPFFCVKQGHHNGLGISEQKVTKIIDAKKGKIQYILTNYDMQNIGENIAYFSFRELQNDLTWKQQFSTRDFVYQVNASIYNDGIKDSNYIWTFEEILRYFSEWVKTCEQSYDNWSKDKKTEFDIWFNTIKAILNENAAANLMNQIEELKWAHFTLKSGETGILRTIRDDRFSLNHTVKKVATIDSQKEDSALVIAEIDNEKQNTFYFRKVGTI